jgi:hypothetical protein
LDDQKRKGRGKKGQNSERKGEGGRGNTGLNEWKGDVGTYAMMELRKWEASAIT